MDIPRLFYFCPKLPPGLRLEKPPGDQDGRRNQKVDCDRIFSPQGIGRIRGSVARLRKKRRHRRVHQQRMDMLAHKGDSPIQTIGHRIRMAAWYSRPTASPNSIRLPTLSIRLPSGLPLITGENN